MVMEPTSRRESMWCSSPKKRQFTNHKGESMRRLMLLGAIFLASCGDNRSDGSERGAAADTADGNTLKVPGDSVRLEDTLSTPPASDSVR